MSALSGPSPAAVFTGPDHGYMLLAAGVIVLAGPLQGQPIWSGR